jgi:hypothetical protein
MVHPGCVLCTHGLAPGSEDRDAFIEAPAGETFTGWLRTSENTGRACYPGFSFRRRDAMAFGCRRMIPAVSFRVPDDNGSAAR